MFWCTPPSDSGWSNIMKQLEELESQGYTGPNVDGTGYSDAEKETLGKLLNGG